MNRVATDADLAAIDALAVADAELKRLLKDVRISLETVYLSADDRADVIDSFRRFIGELGKADARPDRLMRYWRQIDELAPTAAHELAKSEAIQQRSLCWGECIQPKGGYLNEAAAREFVKSVGDPRIRYVLEGAHAEMLELSMFGDLRPEGAFDLLYFYKLLASWFEMPYLKVEIPVLKSATE